MGETLVEMVELDAQRIDAAPIGAQHAQFEFADGQRLAAPRQMPEVFHDDARDGVESFVRPLDAETIVEVGDRRRTAYDELSLALFADVLLVFDVELLDVR